MKEFELIERFFAKQRASDAVLGIGDDCALLAPPAGYQLAISTDMLVEGHHFFVGTDPRALGHKALAVNLSDLAAMGARPSAFTLALALPEVREDWLAPFSEGLFALANSYGCALIGGDTTAGPLNLCLTVFGYVEAGRALRRDAARVGDDIWISGTLGDARLALGALRNEWTVVPEDLPALRHSLEWPQPRVALGQALQGIAHAAIDLSDGLAGDLAHIVKRSNVSATVSADLLPRSAALARAPLSVQRHCTIVGGDDYELCFTAAESQRDTLAALSEKLSIPLTRVGKINAFSATEQLSAERIQWLDTHGMPLAENWRGFEHFAKDE